MSQIVMSIYNLRYYPMITLLLLSLLAAGCSLLIVLGDNNNIDHETHHNIEIDSNSLLHISADSNTILNRSKENKPTPK